MTGLIIVASSAKLMSVRRWSRYPRTVRLSLFTASLRYYGRFYPSALSTLPARINTYLVPWLRKKYTRLRSQKKARTAWERVTTHYPRCFAHWAWVNNPLMIKLSGAE